MSSQLTVPSGWTKGEPLVVKTEIIHGHRVWAIQQELSYSLNTASAKPIHDHVYIQWFDTWEEFAEFIQWWNEGK